TPRWSRFETGAAAQAALLPLSIAGLPGRRACVWVGPPLFWRAAKPGSAVTTSDAPVLHVLSVRRLLASEVIPNPQQFFQNAEVFASIVFRKWIVEPELARPAPLIAKLKASVELVSVMLVPLPPMMPPPDPPVWPALLWLKVLSVTFSVP